MKYDAIVVGGGINGAIAARMLAEAGKRVLILEAGVKAQLDPAKYRETLQTYYTIGGVRGVPNGPYANNVAAPSPGIPNVDPGYYQYATQTHFASDYLRAIGGTTLHWQGSSIRLVPNDFKLQSTYGHGIDWPIGYDDLEPAYRRAEFEIGVSADVEDQKFFGAFGMWFPEGYVYPMHRMPQSVVDQFFDRTLKGKRVALHGGTYPLRVISIPQGRNSTPNPKYNISHGYDNVSAVEDRDAGLRCQGNSACMPICPVQAKYTALKTIEAMSGNRNVELRAQAVASKLIFDSETGRVTAVEYKRYADPASPEHTVERVEAPIVVLAANTIENATLLLASKTPNRSGQLGKNLMDHPYLYVWGTAPERVYPFRGPDTTSGVESLRDGKFREKHASFRASIANWGWSGAPGAQIAALLGSGVYGRALRERLADQMTRMVKIGFMVEQLPVASNNVTINEEYRDAMGNYRPVLSYDWGDYSLAGLEAAVTKVWPAVMGHAGILDATNYPNPAPPGYQRAEYNGRGYNIMGSGHIVGTHRMGSSWRDSVVDSYSRSWDHPNLFVVGAGSQVTIGTANPTLTAAALTVRSVDAMLKYLA